MSFLVSLRLFGRLLPTPAKPHQQGMPLYPIAQVTHPPIDEMSGIARSRTYPDTYWVHNDSGDRARLFAIRADGSVIVPSFVSQCDNACQPDTPPPVGWTTRRSLSRTNSTKSLSR